MKLEPNLESLDGLPEELRENYIEIAGENGTTTFRLAALQGYKSDVEIAALKGALDKERQARKQQERELRELQERQGDTEALRRELSEKDGALASAAAKQAALEAIQATAGDSEALLPLVLQRVRVTKTAKGHSVAIVDESGVPLLTPDGKELTVAVTWPISRRGNQTCSRARAPAVAAVSRRKRDARRSSERRRDGAE